MIRRDYFLRMIEEFFEALSRIKALKKGQHWREASGKIDEEFQRLVGGGAAAVAQLSETELLARIIAGESTQVVRDKTLMLATLLREAGDTAAAEERVEESRACYLKGLHLLLDALGRGDVFDCPEFVPRVEVFVEALAGAPVPLSTRALLMQHYERTGEFGKAEDELFSMLEAEPAHPGLVEFGLGFYDRLRAQSDANLSAGNLPRSELEAARADLRQRQAALAV